MVSAIVSTMIELPLANVPTDLAPAGAQLLKLLADPTRRRIFLSLMRGETCNCELTQELGLAQNLISHHIKQLREGGLVRERRDPSDARWIYYTINAEKLTEAWEALSAALDPRLLGTRTPYCGPAAALSS